jgi:uncharacterized RDD family membrane protein YckC
MGTRAGVVSRTIAAAIDLVTILVTMLVLYFAIAGVIFVLDPRRFSFPRFPALLLFIVGEVMLFFYLAIGWMSTGRSVGKQVMGLRVVDSKGRKVRASRALLRSALCTLIPVGLYWCTVDSENRGVHDVLLRTIVVYDWSLRPLPSAAPTSEAIGERTTILSRNSPDQLPEARSE